MVQGVDTDLLLMQSAAKLQPPAGRSRTVPVNETVGTGHSESVEDKKLREACNDFEAIFIKQMLSSMRKTVHKTGLLGEGGMAEEIFEDMLYDEYAKKMSRTAGLGLSTLLYNQLK
jgi:peptidoglycan hydrolase FlgJ